MGIGATPVTELLEGPDLPPPSDEERARRAKLPWAELVRQVPAGQCPGCNAMVRWAHGGAATVVLTVHPACGWAHPGPAQCCDAVGEG